MQLPIIFNVDVTIDIV